MSRSLFAPIASLLLLLPLSCMGMATSDEPSASMAWGDSGIAGMPAGAPASGLELDRSAAGFDGLDDGLADLKREKADPGSLDEDVFDGENTETSKTTSPVDGRKLIRTGNISVMVDDYEPFQAALDQRVRELGGFIADANLSHYSGRVSWASLTIRVNAQNFEELIRWTESQVEVQSLDVGTQDVTEEWVDVRSRIDNGKRTEQRLLDLLEDRTADLEDILAVERELARVRGEIEGFEGRMRVLADQVELATLTLSVSVRNPYEPAVDPPGFGHQIVETFKASIQAMVALAKGLVLLATAAGPWLLLMAAGLYVVYRILRSLLRRKNA